MKLLTIITLLSALTLFSEAQTAHPILRDLSVFQQEDQIVLRWVIFGGNTCQGTKIFRGSSEADLMQIGSISGICGSTDSDETYTYVDSNAIANTLNYYKLELGYQGFSQPVSIFFEQFGPEGVLVISDPLNKQVRILHDNLGKKIAELTIVDQSGLIISRLKDDTQEFSVDMRDWDSGIYFFQLKVNDRIRTGKLFNF